MSQMTRIAQRLVATIDAVCVILLVVMLAVTSYQVFARYVLNSPTYWSDELVRFLLVWLTMLGSAALIRDDEHIAVDYFFNRLPRMLRVATAFVRDALTVALSGLLALYGYQLVVLAGRASSAGLGVKMAYPYAAIPVGAALIAVVLVLARLEKVTGGKPSESMTAEARHVR
ncbi:MAG TPA: TRAP transporter small permease [Rhodocyclaceae bacterium]|nr:TRAP transporter small permease [Rhodocyclaceae bacterium]